MAEIGFHYPDNKSDEFECFFSDEPKTFQDSFEDNDVRSEVIISPSCDIEKNFSTDDETDDEMRSRGTHGDHSNSNSFIVSSDLTSAMEALDIKVDTHTDLAVKCEKTCTTDDETEDSFFHDHIELNPLIIENESLKKAINDSNQEIQRLKQEMKEMRIFFNNREKDITAYAESTITAMDNEFQDERNTFDEERKAFAIQQNNFLFERHDLVDEIESLKMQANAIEIYKTSEEMEAEKKALLNQLIQIKTNSALCEEKLQERLEIAECNAIKSNNEVIAMEMLKLAMENRIDQLEDEKELAFQKHESQVAGLLKSAASFERMRNADDDENSGIGGGSDDGEFYTSVLADTWIELYRKQLDEERLKTNTLKGCMMRFSNLLSQDDNDSLLQAGIILVPMDVPPNSPTSVNPPHTFGSLFTNILLPKNERRRSVNT